MTWREWWSLFRFGRCGYCRRWGWLLRSEGLHEQCWIDIWLDMK